MQKQQYMEKTLTIKLQKFRQRSIQINLTKKYRGKVNGKVLILCKLLKLEQSRLILNTLLCFIFSTTFFLVLLDIPDIAKSTDEQS